MTKLLSEADQRTLSDLETLLDQANKDFIAADQHRKCLINQIVELKGHETTPFLRRIGGRDRARLAQLNCS